MAQASEAGLPTGEGEDVGDTARSLARLVLSGAEADLSDAEGELSAATATLHEATREQRTAQWAYDITPTGLDALRAAAEDPHNPDRVAAAARLPVAEERAHVTQRAWKASSRYTEARARRARSARLLDRLRVELVQRRCREHGVIPPPDHPDAFAAWQHTPDGDLHGRVVAAVGATGVMTFMLPAVRDAAMAGSDLPAAHWGHVPGPWLPLTVPARLARARATGDPWAPSQEDLVAAIRSSGAMVRARPGTFAGAKRGDRWVVAEIEGPLRIPGTDLHATAGWVAVRDRDEQVRALPDLSRFYQRARQGPGSGEDCGEG